MWGLSMCGVRVSCWGPMPSMPVRSVARTVARTSPSWHHPAVNTPTACSTSPGGSWSRMACPLAQRVGTGGATTGCWCPLPRSTTGAKLGGKKAQARIDTAFLAWALAAFAGDVAADERYDGPFWVRSAVDNRCYKRLLHDVLDHDPTHEDIRAFLRRRHTALAARDLTLLGMTPDGSPLSPPPLAEVFSGGPPQRCQLHVVKDIVKAVVQAVSSERTRLAAQQPPWSRGRPSTKAAPQAARTHQRLAAPRAAWFASRSLFVPRHLHTTARKTLGRVSRGLPQ
jgi:hypothetical protein